MIFKKIKVKTEAKPGVFGRLLLVPSGSVEWDRMWKKVARHPVNKGLPDPIEAENGGEVWQYMESHKAWLGYKHCFRHRYHPASFGEKRIVVRSSLGLVIVPNAPEDCYCR